MFGRGKSRGRGRGRGHQVGRTDLHYAVVDGKTEEVRRLVAAGADTEAADLDLRRPLHFAGMHQQADSLALLLDAGAEIDPRDSQGQHPAVPRDHVLEGVGGLHPPAAAGGRRPAQPNNYGHSPVEVARKVANFEIDHR